MKPTTLLFARIPGRRASSAALPAATLSLAAALLLAATVFAAAPPAPRTIGPARPANPREAQAGPAGTLEAWLDKCPDLKKHIVWVAGDGRRQAFDSWTPTMKGRIDLFYQKMSHGDRNLGMHLPADDKVDPGNGQAYFTADVAFDVYAAHVAHVLDVEARHLVPWSIQSRPGTELDELLASSSYFARIGPSSGGNTYPSGIQANRDFTEAPENSGLGEFNGDPRIGYDFLSGKTSATHKTLIGQTELETLVNLTVWLRDNVAHGPIDGKGKERVKTQRWLDERLRAPRGSHTAIAIEGCHSASKLMVDLARSVNIPLLHTRALDNVVGDKGGNFFNRSHGGLVYGWGSSKPRVLWHTDDLYAMPCRICFPLDPRTSALAAPEQAAQQYFDELWASPQTLKKAGFVFRLERVIPGKGNGVPSRGAYEDRLDYGMMCGYWNKKGESKLDELHQLSHDYALCGQTLLHLARQQVVEAQLTSNIKLWKGDFSDNELPLLRPIKDYADRAAAGLKAVGGAAKFDRMCKEMEKDRGKDLLVK